MVAIIDFVLVSDIFHVFRKCDFQNMSEFYLKKSLSIRLEHKMYNDRSQTSR